MSRFLRHLALGSLSIAAVAVTTNSGVAGCHSRYRYHHHAPRVVHHVVTPPVAVHPPIAPAPAKPAAQLPSVPAGATLTLPGSFLGAAPGHVFLVLNHVKLPAQVRQWNPNGVTITLPAMAVKQPTPARIDVVLPQGNLSNSVKILLTPPAPLVLHGTSPAPGLPTGPAAGPAAPAMVQASGNPQIGPPIVQSNPQK